MVMMMWLVPRHDDGNVDNTDDDDDCDSDDDDNDGDDDETGPPTNDSRPS